ncbi:polysaccharide biosynthesis/export family protein [Spirosoma utsteinense]|uniref:Polysaccharide export outer membrane protein n=1 Tax=Spirosoma utsteinense TaxID=2585773 RepID=A0ABR6W8Y5_9BACT|nr:polysaccharide biosynthesis/export family protein [Spirosoma utsteinense]MBC3787403.1 polysaccharide export outer membrane protein [Spirosoma utsteinense]MBC3793042.1 polysaccharide export outer membrane protein [Spirosoma utsteinense]
MNVPSVPANRICYLLSLLLLVSGHFMTGCVPTKQLVYFQGEPNRMDTLAVASRYVPKIQPGDVLSVQVSSLNPEASAFFNPYAQLAMADRGGMQQNTTNSTTPLPAQNGYLVDNTGAIELPMLGKVNVAGQTTNQVKDRLRDSLKEFLKEPTVNIRNLNFRISVMGEVMRPALFTIPNEQITLLEALSLSGDVTIYGRRENVLIIREEDGKRTFARVDLTQRNLFSSPYYYLHPNDVIYVEPGKARAATADRTNQLLPLAISALSFIAVIATRFR